MIDPPTLIVGDFTIPLSLKDKSSRQKKLNREMLELTHIRNQRSLTDIYRAFHSNTKECIFFSVPRETFSKTEHIFIHKIILNRFKNLNNT